VERPEVGRGRAACSRSGILSVLARPFTVEGTRYVGASIGISIYPNDGRDFAELLKNGHAALYDAKENGGGTCACSPALTRARRSACA